MTFTLTPPGAAPLARDRIYVPVDRCRHYWENAIPVPWPDVNLPHGWYLNPDRVPVPATSRAREAEIRHRLAQLAADLCDDPAFVVDSTH